VPKFCRRIKVWFTVPVTKSFLPALRNVDGTDVCSGQCGNGNVESGDGEECDDGGNVGGDGCSPACLIENGWECASNNCTTVCGDGIRAGIEACDDGNVASGDGCVGNCANVEQDWNCSITDQSGKSTCKKCGNNILEADEVGYTRITLINAIVLVLIPLLMVKIACEG
jgi:cysteine-rich repeat protein